jgi:hypothetical protein
MAEAPQRPVYRHLIVKRRGRINLTADVARLKKARRQMQEIEAGTRKELDADLAHLVKRDFLRRTMEKVYGRGYGDHRLDEMSREESRRQGGAIVVATLNKEQVPGGGQLPSTATFWTQRANFTELSPQDAFMEAAVVLQQRFQDSSDTKFALLPEETQAGITLVTVAYSPIVAYPLDPRFGERGFEVGIEFHQVTRLGRVDTANFEVYSEDGTYPIQPPSDGAILTLMQTAEEWRANDKGFLTDEQRQQVRQEREATRLKKSAADVVPPLSAADSTSLARFRKLDYD